MKNNNGRIEALRRRIGEVVARTNLEVSVRNAENMTEEFEMLRKDLASLRRSAQPNGTHVVCIYAPWLLCAPRLAPIALSYGALLVPLASFLAGFILSFSMTVSTGTSTSERMRISVAAQWLQSTMQDKLIIVNPSFVSLVPAHTNASSRNLRESGQS